MVRVGRENLDFCGKIGNCLLEEVINFLEIWTPQKNWQKSKIIWIYFSDENLRGAGETVVGDSLSSLRRHQRQPFPPSLHLNIYCLSLWRSRILFRFHHPKKLERNSSIFSVKWASKQFSVEISLCWSWKKCNSDLDSVNAVGNFLISPPRPQVLNAPQKSSWEMWKSNDIPSEELSKLWHRDIPLPVDDVPVSEVVSL